MEQTNEGGSQAVVLPTPSIARFYYPVRRPGGVIVHAVYETDQERGVELLYEDGRPVLFRSLRLAAGYCDELNAHDVRLPAMLPETAMRFLLRHRRRARVIAQHGRRYLVLPMGVA